MVTTQVDALCKLDLAAMQQLGLRMMDRRRLSDFITSYMDKDKKAAELYEELQQLEPAVRLPAMAEMFVLNQYDKLRHAGDGVLSYRRTHLDSSLLVYSSDDAGKVLEWESRAVAAFAQVLGYIGSEQSHEGGGPQVYASRLLREGVEVPELRDEIYVQLMMQITDNPSITSCTHLWQLLGLLADTFAPTHALLPHVEVFLFRGTQPVTGSWLPSASSVGAADQEISPRKATLDNIKWIAQTSLRRLRTRVAEGNREVPSEGRIRQQFQEHPTLISVFFEGGSSQKFCVDRELTIKGLTEMVSIQLRVAQIATYALYDVSTLRPEPIALRTDTPVLALMREWQRVVPLSNKPFAKKVRCPVGSPGSCLTGISVRNACACHEIEGGTGTGQGVARHQLVLRRRLHVPTLNRAEGQAPDPVELGLQFMHAKSHVVSGQWTVPDAEVAKLAASSLQIEYRLRVILVMIRSLD